MILWSITCSIDTTGGVYASLVENGTVIMKILKVNSASFSGDEIHTANRIVFAVMDEETETLLRLKYGYVFQVHKGW